MIKDSNMINKYLPILISSLLLVHTLYQLLRATINEVLLFNAHIKGELKSYIIFGDPLHPSLWGFAILLPVVIGTWMLSTRTKFYHPLGWRIIHFLSMFLTILLGFMWNVTAATYNHVVPYFSERADMIDVGTDTLQAVLIGNTHQFLLLLMTLPIIAVTLLLLYLGGLFTKDQNEIMEAFKVYEVNSKWLQRFTKSERKTGLPDVDIGPDSETGEMVTIPGADRSLNTVIIGSIGTGKSAALGLPLINQDLHHFTKFINDYPVISQREDYNSIKGNYLNGLVVIEPSNDLCRDVYKLCKAHGIPDEAIYYVDPTNPNTPSINPLQGPVDKVAESLAMVVEGLGENDNFFFEQSQRAHLKQYVYMLKLHSDEDEPTFRELYAMYNDVQLVHQMHMKLKDRIKNYAHLAQTEDEKNFWDVVIDTDRWFDANIVPVVSRNGEQTKITEGPYRGQIEYYDKKAEFIEGLKNILSDLSQNALIRRVLFKKSSFDFDAHFEAGGILLVNTEKGNLMELSNVLGKMVLLSVQNAVFRREPRVSPHHSVYADEFPEYIYKPFRNFPSQSRKYKTNIHVIAQTIAQLADDYGENYMHTLLTTFRNKMVYSDVSKLDAETFSFLFHEKSSFIESTTEQSVSPLQDSPMTRQGSSYQQEKEAVLSPADILSLRAFECAAKIVVNNESKPARKVKANFVPREEFVEAVVKVDKEAGQYWLKDREKVLERLKNKLQRQEDQRIETVEEQEERIAEENEILDQALVEQVISNKHFEQPNDMTFIGAPQPRIRRGNVSSKKSSTQPALEIIDSSINGGEETSEENEEQAKTEVKQGELQVASANDIRELSDHNKSDKVQEVVSDLPNKESDKDRNTEDKVQKDEWEFFPSDIPAGAKKTMNESKEITKEKPKVEVSKLTSKEMNLFNDLIETIEED